MGLDALLLSMNAIGERAPGLADEARDAVREGRKLLYERVKVIHTARYPYESDLLFKDSYEME